MRHVRSSPLAIAALACGVGEAASVRSLVTPSGLALGLAAGGLRAPLSAVDIAPVAVAADHHLATTTGAVEQTRAALHRLLRPMRAGLEPNPERYSPVGRAPHGLGARHREDCGGRDRCRACLNGPDDLADSHRVVTLPRRSERRSAPRTGDPLTPPSGHAQHPPRTPPATRIENRGNHSAKVSVPGPQFTTLVGDLPRYSPTMRRLGPPSTFGDGLR